MTVCVYAGSKLAAYSLGDDHPFGPARHDSFLKQFNQLQLQRVSIVCEPVQASRDDVELFHQSHYVDKVIEYSVSGEGFLDAGDTPAFIGAYDAAATVVGSTLAAIDRVMAKQCQRAFVPIAGLHHGRRDTAAGFCIFNDCAVAIEHLRRRHGINRILYVDIDAHHGDGVFYSYENDPQIWIVDMHEDGRYLYPGSGFVGETGTGSAKGTKQNYPMAMGADDKDFLQVWQQALPFMERVQPEFILFQCGADSMAGDPITDLRYTEKTHRQAASDLCRIADQYADGRIVAMGGGGYNLDNLARAWCAVVAELGS